MNTPARFTFGVLVVALLAALPGARQPADRLTPAFERIDAYVDQHMRDTNVPGVAIAVTDKMTLHRVATYGHADRKERRPLTPEALFELGSISKTFTAVALLQLAQEGRFDPQQPVTKYLPWLELKSLRAPITGHHLLTHTSGLPHDRDDIPPSLYKAVAAARYGTGFPPGERFAYSNTGYQILGYVLEAIEKQPYAEIVRQRIFQPLGMRASEAALTPDMRLRLAVGYVSLYDDRPPHRTQPLVEAPWVDYATGDGSISATAADAATFLRMLLNRGAGPSGRLLSDPSFARMIERAAPLAPGANLHYGYGAILRTIDGHAFLEHGGDMPGYRAMMLGDLDAGLGIVVLMNGPGDPMATALFAMSTLRAAAEGRDLPPVARNASVPVANAAEYAGTYTGADGRALQLVAEDGELRLVAGARRVALERRGRDRFYIDDPDWSRFLLGFGRDKEGRVVEATYGPEWLPSAGYAGPRKFGVKPDLQQYVGAYRAQIPEVSNFRVVLRKGELLMILPDGRESRLVALTPANFRMGDPSTPDRVRFDVIVNGQALRAAYGGTYYYRTLTR